MAELPDPSEFTTEIDNPYFILRPGTTFVFEDKDENSTDIFTVTHETKVVDGVLCVVVHDTAMVNGLVVEDTFDWFAQDSDGNVWYFGEDSHEFEPGNPIPINDAGSWESGIDGARAGIIMEADPEVGDRYRQELAPGIAEDFAVVEDLHAAGAVPYGSSTDALKTRDVNPLDPSVEHKYYIPGVGNVLTTDAEGGRQELVKIIVNGQAGDDRLLGYAGGDDMFGKAGDDILRGLGGDDRMHGGSGNDRLVGAQGDDMLWGDAGRDFLDGGAGSDGLSGGAGADVVNGGAGRDFLSGGDGNDAVRGGDGGDDLKGGAGNDRLSGGEGADAFIFQHLDNGVVETDRIFDYSLEDIDTIDFANGSASVASEALIGGEWQLTLEGDGDILILLGISDENSDGHIVDDLFIV